jgi:hypothetical protein
MGISVNTLAAILGQAVPADTDSFQMVVDTTKAGSDDTHFILPLASGPTYDVTVDWGDGSTDDFNTSGDKDHTYDSSGTYTVSVKVNTGALFIKFNDGGDKLKVMEISQWGTGEFYSFNSAFYGCANLTITATDEATANTGGVGQFNSMFAGCTSLTSFPLLDTSSATTMDSMCYQCTALQTVAELDTSSVTTMASIFESCEALEEIPAFDTSSVTSLYGAFYHCYALTAFPLLDTGNVTNFEYCWTGDSGLDDYDFPLLNMRKMTAGAYCFAGVTISVSSCNKLLRDIGDNTTVNSVTFNLGSAVINPIGRQAFNHLTLATGSGGHGWTISSGAYSWFADDIISTTAFTDFTNGDATISASSTYSGYPAWQVHDGSNSGWYTASGSTGWVKIVFTNARTAKTYAIFNQDDASGGAAREWTMEGSNDGTNWTVLDTVSRGAVNPNAPSLTRDIASPASYTQYRLNITNNGGGAETSIGEWSMTAW